MIDLRDLECLVALSRYRHFARAAQECGLSQPAFSARIQKLEKSLDSLIVKRGNRFQQLTPEGQLIVAKARSILEDVHALEGEVKKSRGVLSGSLIVGVIPTATAKAAEAAIRLWADHPEVRTRILTAPSLEILQGLEDGRFDAGITYTDGVTADSTEAEEIYAERYVLVAPEAWLDGGETIPWTTAADIPLTLLEPAMQNRRIVDRIFDDIGKRPRVICESNGFNAAIVFAKAGVAATIVPEILVPALGIGEGLSTQALVDPVVEKSISLVLPRHGGNRAAADAFQVAIEAGEQ